MNNLFGGMDCLLKYTTLFQHHMALHDFESKRNQNEAAFPQKRGKAL